MPMLVRPFRPDKAITLLGGDGIPSFKQPGRAQHPIYTAGTDSYHISIQHHKGKASVALGWMKTIIVDDRLFLPTLQPIITGDPMIVFVDLPVTLAPVVKFAGAYFQPSDKSTRSDIGLAAPETNKVNYLIPCVVGNPSGI